ncbi:MAG: RNHCP domain-containing protein [Firmicutes bacterium HGW-Firmicutes-21]|nr:MAG: RNHCP domain-containing protein [Firmicutes bacterium HGW-Firmicutes-21]
MSIQNKAIFVNNYLNGDSLIVELNLFTKNDSGFICENCGKEVPPLSYSSRNHCPFCLCSKHVDVSPGDRRNECGAVMRPIAVNTSAKKEFIITHKCSKCGSLRNNRSQEDDDRNKLIFLTNPYNY